MASYTSKVENGKLNKSVSLHIADSLKALEGNEVKITIEKIEDSRSNQQNKYWWSMVSLLGGELGYTKDEMHDILKVKFLTRTKYENGKTVDYVESTANLTVTEFKVMTESLIRWSAETFDIVLPHP